MIKLELPKIGNNIFSSIFGKLYIQTSIKPLPRKVKAPKELKDYLETLYNTFNTTCIIADQEIKNNYCFTDNKNVLCAFSGGKDSVANVLKLKQMGYNPILVYIKGINRSYPNERSQVKILADKLNAELVELSIKVSGKCDYIENPTKNAFILSLLVDYGINHNIKYYSFGNMLQDKKDEIPKDVELSDAIEFFELLEKFYQNYINDFKIINTLKNETDSYYTIIKYDSTLLDNTISCITPYMYQKQLRQKNTIKYNMQFKDNSCGCSCYKCCQELYTLHKYNIIDLNDEIIKQCEKIFNNFDNKNNTKTTWFDENIK